MAPCPTPPCEPPLLSSLRYQDVQAAQKALGTAAAEVLPEAEKALATMQRVGVDAAPRLALLAAPMALVSLARQSLELQGGGRAWGWVAVAAGKPVRPRQRQMM